MNYCKFQNSTDIKEIGDFPQSDMAKFYDPKAHDSFWNVKYTEFPDFVPNLQFKLNPRAKTTDIVSAVGLSHGFVVNDSVRLLLKKFKLPEHAFYPLKLFTKNSTLDYFWFHFICNDFWEWIDMENSKLYLRSILPDRRSEILEEINLIKASTELVSIFNNRPRLTDFYWDKIIFNRNFPKFDIFSLSSPSLHVLISEDLNVSFKTNNISGYEVSELCKILVP
ncbi:MAG: hypothetical protein WBB24_16570 [Maribacter sp.]